MIRQVIDLTGLWGYRLDPQRQGRGEKWHSKVKDLPWEQIMVPGCIQARHVVENRTYEGEYWYQRTIFVPSDWAGNEVSLVFDGVCYECEVWVNGTPVGRHEGGFTRFAFDVSASLKCGDVNTIVVWGHNIFSATTVPPAGYDYFNSGGIYRGVRLELRPLVHVKDLFIKPTATGEINIVMNIENLSKGDYAGNTTIEVAECVNPGKILNSKQIGIKVPPTKTIQERMRLTVPFAKAWIPEEPNLYLVKITIGEKTNPVDAHQGRFGLRTIEVKGHEILLNGKRIRLVGTNRHEDHPEFIRTDPRELIYHDLCVLRDAGMNCFRTSHYPSDEMVMDLCDEMGILVIEEAPVRSMNATAMQNPDIIEKCKQEVREMIARDKNHPCVIGWSVQNECQTDTDAGANLVKVLAELVRSLDDTRFVTMASNKHALCKAYPYVDVYGINAYKGWYEGAPADVAQVLDLQHDMIAEEDKDKPILVIEFGAEGLYGFRDFSDDSAGWSENYQEKVLRENIEIMMARDFVAGALVWHFFDFKVSIWRQQGRPHYLGRARTMNNKGIVDEVRRPKMSYFTVRDLFKKWQKQG